MSFCIKNGITYHNTWVCTFLCFNTGFPQIRENQGESGKIREFKIFKKPSGKIRELLPKRSQIRENQGTLKKFSPAAHLLLLFGYVVSSSWVHFHHLLQKLAPAAHFSTNFHNYILVSLSLKISGYSLGCIAWFKNGKF